MKRISTQFAVLLALAAIVPLLAYGAVSILSLRNGAQQTVVQANQDAARRVGQQIELYITSSVRVLKAVAAEMQHTRLVPWQQDRILKNFVLQFPEFTEITLVNENGDTAVSSRLGKPTTDIPGSGSTRVEGALISPFSLDDDLLPSAVVAVRLLTQGDSGGWLIGRLRLEELWRTVDNIGVGNEGYALLVTNEGQLLAHGNPEAKSLLARGDRFDDHAVV